MLLTTTAKGSKILRNEHLLVAFVALLRSIQILLRGVVSAPFLAIFAGIPQTVELGMYAFVVHQSLYVSGYVFFFFGKDGGKGRGNVMKKTCKSDYFFLLIQRGIVS